MLEIHSLPRGGNVYSEARFSLLDRIAKRAQAEARSIGDERDELRGRLQRAQAQLEQHVDARERSRAAHAPTANEMHAQAVVDRLERENARLAERSASRRAELQRIGSAVQAAQEWMQAPRSLPGRQPRRDDPEIQADASADVEGSRARVDDIVAELHALESAPVPLADAEAAIDREIARLADATGSVRGSRFTRPPERTGGIIIMPDTRDSHAPLDILAAIAPDLLRQRWLADVKSALKERKPGLPLAERPEARREIEGRLIAAMREHAAACFARLAAGELPAFHPELPAEILLDVTIAEEAAAAAQPAAAGGSARRAKPDLLAEHGERIRAGQRAARAQAHAWSNDPLASTPPYGDGPDAA